jgi:Holliday junction resolvase-like predicted endonuclease
VPIKTINSMKDFAYLEYWGNTYGQYTIRLNDRDVHYTPNGSGGWNATHIQHSAESSAINAMQGINAAHKSVLGQAAQVAKVLDVGVGLAIGLVNEPADMALAIAQIIDNPGEGSNYLAVLPFVPLTLVKGLRHVDDAEAAAAVVSKLTAAERGEFGEAFVRLPLKKSGYTILSSKINNSGHGIDVIAAKLNPDGSIKELVFIESKFAADGRLVLKDTLSGKQMSREWIEKKLKDMVKSNDPAVQESAKKIREHIKNGGKADCSAVVTTPDGKQTTHRLPSYP